MEGGEGRGEGSGRGRGGEGLEEWRGVEGGERRVERS